MKWLGYVWQVLAGFCSLLIAIAAVSAVSNGSDTDFARVVVSGILLILLAVSNLTRWLSTSQVGLSMHLIRYLREIHKKLEIPVESDEEIKEALDKVDELRKKTYIPAIFDGMIWLLAVWNLLAVVLA